ncbi:hypothetical protein WMF31_19455 [Sorangium sp. So ce1036]|uniref:hypothetical protein n=1 Tax=Sorangium sp. So ce1036 TaxID=3133328 RepID=UPI003F07A6EB
MLSRFVLLVRTLAATAGKDAVARAMPLYMGVAVVAAVLFGGNGMQAAQVTGLAGASLPFRLALWAGWLFLGTPAARALLRAPATFFLRALPVPRRELLAAHALLLAVFLRAPEAGAARELPLVAGGALLALSLTSLRLTGGRLDPEGASRAR